MKHAYLFIAHNNFDTLHKCLLLLDSPENDFFLHIDQKATHFDEDELKSGIRFSHISFLPRRSVEWGADSMIRCELELLEMAITGQYGYYHLLSAADFPIKPPDVIHRYFEEHKGLEFVSFREKPYENDSLMKCVTGYCPPPNRYRKSRFYHKAVNLLARIYRRKLLYAPEDYRFGANWFSITHALAEYIVAHREELEKQYRNTLCCDEIFLQSLVYNSPFREHVYGGTDHYDFRFCLRKIDWARGNPYVFRSGDYEELMTAGEDFLFARKFDEKVDSNIIKELFCTLKPDTVPKKGER